MLPTPKGHLQYLEARLAVPTIADSGGPRRGLLLFSAAEHLTIQKTVSYNKEEISGPKVLRFRNHIL